MKNPKRVTVALDEETSEILDEIVSENDVSRSEAVRRAIKFYGGSKDIRERGDDRLSTYLDMLSKGEHVILDIDRWLLLLELLESSDQKEEFWEKSKKVADSHADQLDSKIDSFEDLLTRLEVCNFFSLNKISDKEYTLVVNSKESKKFVKRIVEDFSESMGFDVEIMEDIGKLRTRVKDD